MRNAILALAASALVLAGCQSIGTAQGRTITVTGSGSVQVVPDIATFSVLVEETRPTTALALSDANAKVAQVLSVLKGKGIESKDISTQSVRLSPSYEWRNNTQVLVGQSCRQSISVKVKDLEALGPVVDALGMVDGISLQSLSFDKEDKQEAYRQAREDAVRDAYDKAKAYADPLSLEVGKARSVVEGDGSFLEGRPVYKQMALMESASADSTIIERGTLEVDSHATIVFELF